MHADAAAAFAFALHTAAILARPSHARRPAERVWQLLGLREKQEAEEWMYQLARQEGADPWRHLNTARAAYGQKPRKKAGLSAYKKA